MRQTAAILVLISLGAACLRQEVAWSEPTTKTAEQRPTQWGAPARERLGLPDMRGGSAAGTQLVGDAPAGWQEQAAQPARFRDRLWQIAGEPEAECYLTNAVGGGVAQNLARWYGQFGAQPQAVESLLVIEFAGRTGRLLDLKGTFAGKPEWAMLLAFAASGEEVTTLKFTGPERVVAAHREEFLTLAKTLRRASASPMPEAPPIDHGQEMPPGHPPVGGEAVRDTTSAPGMFTAEVPSGWQPVAGSQRLLHHSFGDGGEVYVSQLGGTVRQNLDIWRGEIAGAGVLTDAEYAAVPKTPMLGGEASLMDLRGDFHSMSGKQIPAARLIVAAIPQDGGVVFAKLVGKADEVEAQRAAFLRFCESMRRRS